MNKWKLVLRILWTVPITCFLIFLVLMFIPGAWPFPEAVNLGNAPAIDFVVKSPKHLFYIARYFSIMDDYDKLLTKVKFKVLDSSGKEINCETYDHFFLGEKIDGKNLDAGSVFRLSQGLTYPLKIRLESNVADLDGIVWVGSEGSFLWVALAFLGAIAASIFINYRIYIKCRKKLPDAANASNT